MPVIFDPDTGWTIAAISCFIGFIVLVVIGEAIQASDAGKGYKLNRPSFYIAWSITLVGLYIVANLFVASTSLSSEETPDATSQDLAASFGLESGKEYPLELGERFSGTTGEVHGGLFWVSGSFQPATALSVGFEHGSSSYMLEFPTATVTFKQVEGVSPSVVMYLSDEQVSYGSHPAAKYVTTYGPCEWTLHNLWFVCEKDVASSTLVVSDDAQQLGLGPVVQEYFKSATITLTPEMYDALLQGN